MPTLFASVVTTNSALRLGCANTGAVVGQFFKNVKASSCSLFHMKVVFFSNSFVSGCTCSLTFLINFLSHLVTPRNFWTSLTKTGAAHDLIGSTFSLAGCTPSLVTQ